MIDFSDCTLEPLQRDGELVLYRSELRPSGSVYTPLAVFPLGGAPAPLG